MKRSFEKHQNYSPPVITLNPHTNSSLIPFASYMFEANWISDAFGCGYTYRASWSIKIGRSVNTVRKKGSWTSASSSASGTNPGWYDSKQGNPPRTIKIRNSGNKANKPCAYFMGNKIVSVYHISSTCNYIAVLMTLKNHSAMVYRIIALQPVLPLKRLSIVDNILWHAWNILVENIATQILWSSSKYNTNFGVNKVTSILRTACLNAEGSYWFSSSEMSLAFAQDWSFNW